MCKLLLSGLRSEVSHLNIYIHTCLILSLVSQLNHRLESEEIFLYNEFISNDVSGQLIIYRDDSLTRCGCLHAAVRNSAESSVCST